MPSFGCNSIAVLGAGRVPSSYTVGEVDASEQGESVGWKVVGPSHKRRHLLLIETVGLKSIGVKRSFGENSPESHDPRVSVGTILRDIKTSLLTTSAFGRYLELLTSLVPTGHRDEIRRFRPGLDYTIAHMGAMSKEARLEYTTLLLLY